MNSIAAWFLPFSLAFLPFCKGVLQVEIAGITFNPYSLVIILCAGMAPIYAVIRPSSPYNFNVTDLFITLLCLVFLASTLLSDTLTRSGYVYFHGLFIPALSYLAIKSFVRDEQQFQRAFSFFIFGVLVFGAIQFVHFLKTFSRVTIFNLTPIDFASLCVVGILYVFFVKGLKKITALLTLIPLLVLLFINLPRAYLLALLISPLLYLVIRKGKAALLMFMILLMTLSVTVLLAANADQFRVSASQALRGEAVGGLDRLTSLTYWKQTIYGRGIHFRQGLQEFAKAPVFGQGIKVGKSEYSWKHTYFTWHNFNIQWLVFGGVVGYLLYSGVLLGNFIATGRYARNDTMAATVLLAIALVLINSLTNGIMHGMMPYVVFILLGFSESRLRALKFQPAGGPAPARGEVG